MKTKSQEVKEQVKHSKFKCLRIEHGIEETKKPLYIHSFETRDRLSKYGKERQKFQQRLNKNDMD